MSVASIRLATGADIEPVLALWAEAHAVPSVTDDAQSVQVAIDRETLLVAEIDDEVVGSLIAAFDGWRGNMYRLAVHPDHRRGGVAAALVTEGHNRLAREGCQRVNALVATEHPQATGFWHAAGYDHDERIARFVTTFT